MTKLQAFVTSALFLLTGCSGPAVEDYAGKTPAIDIRQFLNGKVEAWGVFIDRFGDVEPRFHVAMRGEWKGNTRQLYEHFTYTDGRTQDRVWTFIFTDDNHFTGTADDVIGTGEGAQFGNAVNMKYVLRVTTSDGDTHDVKMDDWLYKIDDHTLMNRTVMRKFGFKVGELIISFYKPGK